MGALPKSIKNREIIRIPPSLRNWSAVGALWALTALGTPQSGHGSGRGRVGMLAKNHFTLQKVNTDDLYNALMLCEVNVEVTSLCVK